MAGHELPRRRREGVPLPRPRHGTPRDWPAVPRQSSVLRLIVMPADGWSPVWVESGTRVRNTPPAELPIAAALAERISRWGEGYASPADRAGYFKRGLVLALRLAEMLGGAASVEFYDGREGILRRL